MKTSYKYNPVVDHIKLVKKSNKDRIATVYTKDVGITKAKLGQCYEFTLIGLVKVLFAVNRKDGSTLSINEALLPKYVESPKVGKNKTLHVIGVRRLY